MTDLLESFTPGLPEQAVAAMCAPVRRVWRQARVATLADPFGWGLIERGAIVTEDARIAWIGPETALPALGQAVVEEHDLGGALVTPGLVDAHTHLVYGGHRAHEFEMRLQGATYEDIAKAGGGIRSTVSATRAASEDELFAIASRRLKTLRAGGVTTVEIKSGYGLSFEAEAKCLRVARRLGRTGVGVRTTSLAAHALPPEFEGRADDYIAAVCEWLPKWHAEGLVDAVDAFCERIAFSPAQVERVFATAAALGLPVKLHAEQLSESGGAELAARFKALSCDHLEYLGEAGIAAMRSAGTVAMLLPGAYHFLRETRLPPIAALREAGVAMAVSTDHNPGTSPTLSLPLMIHLACVAFRLTPEEAVRGATVNAARALGLADRGMLAVGRRADFALWDLEHPRELAYWFGHPACRRTVVGAAADTTPPPAPDTALRPPRGPRAGQGRPVARPVFKDFFMIADHPSFHLKPGTTPLLVSLPHCGELIPDELKSRYRPRALDVEDTDWHLHQLYAFAAEMGASVLQPRASRFVIDLNRPSDDAPMYPGANNTELCPTRFFTGDPIYVDGGAPTPAEITQRTAQWWQPYHGAIATELARLRAQHGHAVIFDGHSIKSELPWLFEGKLPALNLGTVDGRSCAPSLRAALSGVLAAQDRHAHVVDGRFKGGYITRHYGKPADGVHAVQLEMTWECYMDETPPYAYRPDKAAQVQPLLRELLRTMRDWTPQ